MYKFLEDSPVRITCHACGKTHEKKMKWMKKNKTLKCKKCDKKIDLTTQDVKKAVKEIAQAISAFEIALGKMHKAAIKVKNHKSSAKRMRKPAPAAPTPTPVAKEKRSFV